MGLAFLLPVYFGILSAKSLRDTGWGFFLERY